MRVLVNKQKLTPAASVDSAAASQTASLASIAPHFPELVVANNAPEKVNHNERRRQRRFVSVLGYKTVAM